MKYFFESGLCNMDANKGKIGFLAADKAGIICKSEVLMGVAEEVCRYM